jgi:Ser/Thr protein kinase RdoA (MazF antagonist)
MPSTSTVTKYLAQSNAKSPISEPFFNFLLFLSVYQKIFGHIDVKSAYLDGVKIVPPFAELTYEAQLARLTAAAQTALRAYDLADAALRPILYVNNAVFEVISPAGSRFALRLHRPGHKSAEIIQSELVWLQAITAHTPLCVPRPVPTTTGDLFTAVPVEGLDSPVICALLSWIDGNPYDTDTVPLPLIQQAGSFLAQLHNFSQDFTPPPGFTRPRMDWSGLQAAYDPGSGISLFTDDHLALFARIGEQVKAVMDSLGQSRDQFGLIHADLIMKNMLFRGDEVCAIDFDDCAFGYYLYDLAPLLLQLKDEPRYADLQTAFWQGYTTFRPQPESHLAYLETFIAARHLASCYWIAGNLHNPRIRERAPAIIAHRTAELARFLETGSINQRGEHF